MRLSCSARLLSRRTAEPGTARADPQADADRGADPGVTYTGVCDSRLKC